MKVGRSLLDLAKEIERQKETKLDLLAAPQQMEMGVAGDPLTGIKPTVNVAFQGRSGSFGVTDHAHDQIASGVEIPRAYYRRMLEEAPELLARNVNEWFGRDTKPRLMRTMDGNVRAMLSQQYRPLDNESLIEFLGPVFEKHGAGLQVMSSEITERRLYLKVAYPAVQGEIAKGDVVQSGFVVANSEVGSGSLSVFPWVLRLMCLNGMKVESAGQRRNHVGRRQEIEAGQVIEYKQDTQRMSDRAIMLRVRDTVEACLEPRSFDRLLDEFRTAAGAPEIERPEKAIKVLSRSLSLNEAEQNSVLHHLIKGGDLTAWGAANAITRAAEDSPSYDRATELEALGYGVIELTKGEGAAWEVIAKAA